MIALHKELQSCKPVKCIKQDDIYADQEVRKEA